MQQHIGGHFHGIIPAKVFEVEERQGAIRAAKAVVKAKIRWHQAALFLRQFSRKIKVRRSQVDLRPSDPSLIDWIEGFIKKIR